MNKLTEHELFRRRMKMITDKEQLIEIYEQLVGDDGINRYTHKEIILPKKILKTEDPVMGGGVIGLALVTQWKQLLTKENEDE